MVTNAQSKDVKHISKLLSKMTETLTDFSSYAEPQYTTSNALYYLAAAYRNWIKLVDYGKEWDFKDTIKSMDTKYEPRTDLEWQKVGKSKYKFDTWSNIHYGFVGAAAGFQLDELQGGAGFAQLKHPVQDGKFIYNSSASNFLARFDPASDSEGIRIGFDLYMKYGLSIRPEDIVSAIENSTQLETKPPR